MGIEVRIKSIQSTGRFRSRMTKIYYLVLALS